jgi:hypothetical protein
MSRKYDAAPRHRVPKIRYEVTDWRDYQAELRQRRSLRIWFTDERAG